MLMKWDLSFCEAEIEGNELCLQLKQARKSIERLFKVYGEYFKYRSLLENFGYDIFRKALKRQVVPLNPDRIEQFITFFNAIQATEELKEAGPSAEIYAWHADPEPVAPWQVDDTAKSMKQGEGAPACASCGKKLPANLGDATFCPLCGAHLDS
jgi:hypothetical protein